VGHKLYTAINIIGWIQPSPA